jgi:hypothetical protein
MRIDALLMCKNESDFIERYIRTNSLVFDHFHIYEDNSADNTKEILKSLQDEGFQMTFYAYNDELSREYHQNAVMSYLMQNAAESADFVVPVDADELVLISKKELHQKCRSLNEAEYGVMKWKTCVPLPHSRYHYAGRLSLYFTPLEKDAYINYKLIVPSEIAKTTNLLMGNHGLGTSLSLLPVDLDIDLYHFPIRSVKQLIAKALITSHKFSIKRNKTKTEGYHIIQIADYIRSKDYKLSQKELHDLARCYLGYDPNCGYDNDSLFLNAPVTKSEYTTQDYPLTKILDHFISEILT